MLDGQDWFTVLIGAACVLYAAGSAISSIISAHKAKAICSNCDDEIHE